MTIVRVRGRGQITLPRSIAKAANITEGTLLKVNLRGSRLIFEPLAITRIRKRLSRYVKGAHSVKDIRATREKSS